MKKFVFNTLFLSMPYIVLAQNLVPNSSFENYTLSSNNTYNQTRFDSCLVNCWVSPNNVNSLNISSLYPDVNSFPIWGGSTDEQLPRTGLTKMKIEQVWGNFTSNSDSTGDLRTYTQTRLVQPLIAGQSYTFTMYVSGIYKVVPPAPPLYCENYAPAKNLGVHLSTTRPMGTIGNYSRLDLIPQISFSGIDFYTQPNGWMELTATYIASGGEEYLTIGNFDYYTDTEFQNGTPVGVPPLNDNDPICTINVRATIAIDDVSLIPFGSSDTTELKLNLGEDTTICGPINLTLNAGNGFPEYFWSTGETSQSITITQPGTYWCKTQEFCSSCSDTIVVSQANFQTINLGNDTTFCTDGSQQILLNPGGLYDSYLWNTEATTATISPTSSGVYWVEANYSCGIATDTIIVTANLIPEPPIVQDTTVCLNTSLIGNATGVNLLWYPDGIDNIGHNNAPDIPTDTVGDQIIFVSQTENGCESAITDYRVSVIAPPYFELEDSIELCSWQDAYVGVSNDTWSFLWNDSIDYSPRTISEEGIYTLTADNQCGIYSASIEIIKNSCDCYFYLPNAFTPDGNAINAEFKPVYDCYFKEYIMRIYNRWGEVVFTTQDPADAWDGTYLGASVNDGIYMVQVVYKDLKYDHQEIYNGHVLLIR